MAQPPHFRRAIVGAVACALAAALLPASAAAANTTGTASVVISLPAGVVGLQDLANANGFLLPPVPVATTGPEALLALSPSPEITTQGGGLAAAVAISGVPNQTFTLTVTDSLVVVTDTGEIMVTNFENSAGESPTIGPDGTARIAIGATARTGDAGNLQALQTQAGGEDGATLTVVVQTPDGPRVVRVRRPDHFGPNLFGDKFFSVLVSYN